VKINDLFKRAVKVGIENDVRGLVAVQKDLDNIKKEYDDLEEYEKKYFDKSLLVNPYPDSSVLADNDTEFGRLFVGIDIFSGELEYINRYGKGHDCSCAAWSHHPEGKANCQLWRVLNMQIGIYKKYGVMVDIDSEYGEEFKFKNIYKKFSRQVREDCLGDNNEQLPQLASKMGIQYMCTHTISDNCLQKYLEDNVVSNFKETDDVNDLLKRLYDEPEYIDAAEHSSGPRVVAGKLSNKLGKVLVDMTGGLEAPTLVMPSLSASGIKTMLVMHISPDMFENAESHRINVICAGHYASDSLGMNLLLDKVVGNEEVAEIGGFIRNDRRNK